MDEILVRSGYLQTVRVKDNFVVYHSLFGYPQILNRDALDLLNSFKKKTNVRLILEKKLFIQARKVIQNFKECFFLVKHDFDERVYLKKTIDNKYLSSLKTGANIEYLSLIISEKCNFACSYCISSSMIEVSERRHNEMKIMDRATAKLAVNTFFSVLRNNNQKKAYVNFGGGEPLLNFKLIEWILRYIHKKFTKDFEITYTINTNASLITRNIAAILKNYKVKIALSLDGQEEANDAVRKTRNGNGTYKMINRAISILKEVDYNPGGFGVTMTEKNFRLISINKLIKFCQINGFSEFRVDLDVIHILKIPLEEAVKKLLILKRKAKRAGFKVTGFWERPTENLNDSILEKLISFCGGVIGKSMCVNPQGKIFICGYSANMITDLKNLNKQTISTSYYKIIAERIIGNINRCRGCSIEGLCGGGCYVSEEFTNLNTKGALEYNCSLYRKMTKALLRDSLKEAISAS